MPLLTLDIRGAWIDPLSNQANKAVNFNNGRPKTAGNQAIEYSGNLYTWTHAKGVGSSIPGYIYVWKSTDGGATWAALDATNSPGYYETGSNNSIEGCASWDGAHTITFVLAGAGIFSYQSMYFRDFDLVSGTWGTAYGTGGPTVVLGFGGLLRRSDGKFVVLYDAGTPATTGITGSRLWCVLFDGTSTYTNNQDLGANSLSIYPTGWIPVLGIDSVIDSSNRVHVIYASGSSSSSWRSSPFYVPCYQAISSSMSLVNFHQFAQDFSNADNFSSIGRLVIFGTALVWAVQMAGATMADAGVYVLKGTPLSGPSWTASAKLDGVGTLDPWYDPPWTPSLIYDAGQDALVLFSTVGSNGGDSVPGQIRGMVNHGATDPLVGWSAVEVLYTIETDAVPADTDVTGGLSPTFEPAGSSALIFSDYQHNVTVTGQKRGYVGRVSWSFEEIRNEFK